MAVHIGDTVRDFYFGLGAADRHDLAEKIGKYAKDSKYICPPEGVKWSPQAGGKINVHFVRLQGTDDIQIDWIRV